MKPSEVSGKEKSHEALVFQPADFSVDNIFSRNIFRRNACDVNR